MDLFFDPDFNHNNTILNEIESKHCISVMRKKVGDTIHVTDGNGNLFIGKIKDGHPKCCQLIIDETVKSDANQPLIHIAIAPTKNIDRFEWFLEKATEIGITEITPILCKHSERKQIRLDRMEKVIVAAMKQSIKFYKPKLNELISINELVKTVRGTDKFIAHCDDSERVLFKNCYQKNSNAIILIGPEGDFSPNEISTATKSGFQPISLGNNRLRTETAGVVACTTVSIINED